MTVAFTLAPRKTRNSDSRGHWPYKLNRLTMQSFEKHITLQKSLLSLSRTHTHSLSLSLSLKILERNSLLI